MEAQTWRSLHDRQAVDLPIRGLNGLGPQYSFYGQIRVDYLRAFLLTCFTLCSQCLRLTDLARPSGAPVQSLAFYVARRDFALLHVSDVP